MDYEELKSRIVFVNPTESMEFEKYLQIRWIGLDVDTFQTLEILSEHKQITYQQFCGLIRYDKQLRDVIYQYIAALEEFWKNHLFSHCEYVGKKDFGVVNNKNENDFTVLLPDQKYGWKLYRNSLLDFGSIIKLYKKISLPFPKEIDSGSIKEEQIKDLRNKVMHHKMLTIDQSNALPNKDTIFGYRDKISQWIMSLIEALPESYRIGFRKDLYKCNHDKKTKAEKSPLINYDEYGVK